MVSFQHKVTVQKTVTTCNTPVNTLFTLKHQILDSKIKKINKAIDSTAYIYKTTETMAVDMIRLLQGKHLLMKQFGLNLISIKP